MLRVGERARSDRHDRWLVRIGPGQPERPPELDVPHTIPSLSIAETDDWWVLVDGQLRDQAEPPLSSQPASLTAARYVADMITLRGPRVLEHIRGQFACIAWDVRRGEITAMRDRIGFLPLYHARSGDTWYCSPSVQTLAVQPEIGNGLSRDGLVETLADRWTNPERTHFAQIRRVLPGCLLTVTASSGVSRRFWRPPVVFEDQALSNEEAQRAFEATLRRVVSRQCGDDRPAIYLSGGLDSLSVGIALKLQGAGPATALSLRFPSAETDESAPIAAAAERLGFDLTIVPFASAVGEGGLLAGALEISRSWPHPLANPWFPAYRSLARLAQASGRGVVFMGSGGDEWLGVSPCLAADYLRRLRLRSLYDLYASTIRAYHVPRRATARRVLWTFGARPLVADSMRAAALKSAPSLLRRRWRAGMARWLPPWVIPRQQDRDALFERLIAARERTTPEGSYYERETYATMDHATVLIELEETSHIGWLHGFRFAMPYWDDELIELLTRIPPRALSQGDRAKGLVRPLVARELSDLDLEQRRKVVAARFFLDNLRADLSRTDVTEPMRVLGELGLIDVPRVRGEIARFRDGGPEHDPIGGRLWYALIVGGWVLGTA